MKLPWSWWLKSVEEAGTYGEHWAKHGQYPVLYRAHVDPKPEAPNGPNVTTNLESQRATWCPFWATSGHTGLSFRATWLSRRSDQGQI